MPSLGLFSKNNDHQRTEKVSHWNIFRSKPSALIGLVGSLIILLLTLSSGFVSHDETAISTDVLLLPPSWDEKGSPRYPLGTDLLGRDIFSRLIEGASSTIGTAILSVSFALIVGVSLGLLAAYYRSYVQLIVMRTMDIILAIPSLILAIIVVVILGTGLFNAGIAVALVILPNFVRITVNNVIDEMSKAYVDAARLDGAPPIRILLKSVFPNIAAPLTLQTTIALSTAVVDIALLGFLGLGAQAPEPEWGAMLADARTSMHFASWALISPGLAILITVLCINFIGDGLNRVINYKMRH